MGNLALSVFAFPFFFFCTIHCCSLDCIFRSDVVPYIKFAAFIYLCLCICNSRIFQKSFFWGSNENRKKNGIVLVVCDFGVWFLDNGEAWLDSFGWIALRESTSFRLCLIGVRMNRWKMRMWTKLDCFVCLYIHCHPTNYTIPNIYFSWFHFEEDVILDSWYIHASCCLLFLCFCFREKYIIWAPKDVTCHVIVCVCVFFFFFFCLQKFPALQIDPQRYELVSKFITLVEWTC